LEECVKAVNGKIEVYIDGGVRRGTDVLKCLALGANAVFIGRPTLWGLAYDGQQGVESVLDLLNKELRTAMILTGCLSLDQINKNVIHFVEAKL
jgi:(S)-2-hydroxy-acid oxidase